MDWVWVVVDNEGNIEGVFIHEADAEECAFHCPWPCYIHREDVKDSYIP